ncbi:MAG: deoxyribose-phosphate aldolase [Ruminiclostridium sp.]
MILTVDDIAKMMDLSCVKTNSDENDIRQLVENAKKYNCGQVSVMQCFIPLTKALTKDRPDIRIVGNVSFPSGSDTTSLKVAQAKEMVSEGCNEIDMVMNVGKLRSGLYVEVEEDVKAVVNTAKNIPVKVIIEISLLKKDEVLKACQICMDAGAAFVKTGTGWMPNGTTYEDIKLIKSIVGDAIKIKASGGVKDLNMLIEMYKLGAVRFGVNLNSGINILEECIASGGQVEI